jgi:hypothetical protein
VGPAILIAILLFGTTPAFAPPMGRAPPVGRPIEAPRVEPVRPKSEFELRQEAEAARRLHEEQVRVESELREQAIRSFPDFNKQGSYSIFDAVPDGETRAALTNYLESDSTARQIGMNSWRFTSAPKLNEIDRMLTLARSPLPGTVELGLLLDSRIYGDSYKSIVEAWGDRPKAEIPTDGLLTDYLARLKGRTLIIVGHVDGDAYVFEDSSGVKIQLHIKDLLIKAHQNGVVLIPIGCSTAEAGVSIGFIREIGTDAVSNFLRMLPQDKPKIADILGGLFKIGEIRVNIQDAADLFEVQVFDGVNEHPVTRVRVPYGAAQTTTVTSQPAPSLVQIVEMNAEANRPFWRKTWFVAILTNPLTYVALWAFLLATSWIGSTLLSQWAFERRDRQWVYRLIRIPLALTKSAWHGLLVIISGDVALEDWWLNSGEKSERRT